MVQVEEDVLAAVERFTAECAFDKGCLVVDLDGTALMESEGKVFVSTAVSAGVKAVHDLGRPVVLNTLRFPLSVINSVGEDWYKIAETPILTILLNGSVIGYIVREGQSLEYQELMAFPMSTEEIKGMLVGIEQLLRDKIDDVLLFFYSRNWREGEQIWTPHPARIEPLKSKYLSASRVFSGTMEELAAELSQREICMACLFVDRPADTLMAYQHSKRNSFITRKGLDKAAGLRALAEKFSLSLIDSLGAGDTEMDSFLSEVGMAVIVGRGNLPYRGKKQTVRVESPQALGGLLSEFATRIKARNNL